MANKNIPPSLDLTGTQAALYPTEDALWVSGPPINDAGSQGVENPPPAPSAQEVQNGEDIIHEQLNGETTNVAYAEEWVNPGQWGTPGYGEYNEQPFQSGHTNVVQSNPSAEQGWGVGPARRWAHYPIVESPNPFRNRTNHLRNGELPWVTADSSYYERTQLAWEQQWAPYKRRSPVAPVVEVPPSVPFTATVPTYSGGPIPHPGVDIPFEGHPAFGVGPVYPQ